MTYVTHRADIFLEAVRDLRAFCSQGLGSLPRDRPPAPPQQLLPRTRRHRESWTCITGTYHDTMGGKIRAELVPLQPLQLGAHADGHWNGQQIRQRGGWVKPGFSFLSFPSQKSRLFVLQLIHSVSVTKGEKRRQEPDWWGRSGGPIGGFPMWRGVCSCLSYGIKARFLPACRKDFGPPIE